MERRRAENRKQRTFGQRDSPVVAAKNTERRWTCTARTNDADVEDSLGVAPRTRVAGKGLTQLHTYISATPCGLGSSVGGSIAAVGYVHSGPDQAGEVV